MFRFQIAAMALASVVIMGFVGQAQAYGRYCPMPIMKGGCPMVVTTQSGPYLPNPEGK